jgi:hypothetical protein
MAAARRAYEVGRQRRAVWRALVVAPLATVPRVHSAHTGQAPQAVVATLALLALVTLFAWRGQGYARGIRPGLVAGLPPLLLPWLTSATGILCSATLCGVLPVAAVAGGALSGAFLAAGAGGDGAGRRGVPFWFAATAVTVALGAMGCLHVGLAGLAGLALGIVAGAAPAVSWRLLRAR